MIYDLALKLLDDDHGISAESYELLLELVKSESPANADALQRIVKAAEGRWYILSPDSTHCDDCGNLIDNASEGCVDCPGWDYRRDVLGINDSDDGMYDMSVFYKD